MSNSELLSAPNWQARAAAQANSPKNWAERSGGLKPRPSRTALYWLVLVLAGLYTL